LSHRGDAADARPPAAGHIVTRLRAAGCVFAEEEAELLTAAARDDDELQRFVTRRCAGEPLEVIVGAATFCGLRLSIDPGVFVPRVRTEALAHAAVAVAETTVAAAGSVDVVDLCCGCGAIAAVVATRLASARVTASDIDQAAVRCARRNLGPLGVAVYAGDLFDGLPTMLRGTVDVVVANVPYVPTGALGLLPPEARLHEPRHALDGGPDGLQLLRRVAEAVGGWLAPGGAFLTEVSSAQVAAATAVLYDAGLGPRIVLDEERSATVIIARR
jgi:release factor glutamine methyltransferase